MARNDREFAALYPTYDAWCAALDRHVLEDLRWSVPVAAHHDPDAWLQYWTEGVTPQDAMRRELAVDGELEEAS